jgi:RHS repeat-associated protein
MPMPGKQMVGGELYRYAFQGQEKDPETGKEAFQLRLWDSRIGRWLTTDPAGEFHSPYLGMGNNPISNIDPDGGCVKCDPNAKVGSTATDNGGFGVTMTETGWVRDDGYGADLGTVYNRTPFSTPFSDATSLLIFSSESAYNIAGLKDFTKALNKNNFIVDYKGSRKVWSMDYYGGGRGNVSKSLIQSGKINTRVLGGVGRGIRVGGSVLSIFSAGVVEIDYQNGRIDGGERYHSHSTGIVNAVFPLTALGTIPGNYLGRKYHPQIEYQMTNDSSVTKKVLGKTLNLFGIPVSKEQELEWQKK